MSNHRPIVQIAGAKKENPVDAGLLVGNVALTAGETPRSLALPDKDGVLATLADRILPVVTGEIASGQPVFAYLPDGNLVYSVV